MMFKDEGFVGRMHVRSSEALIVPTPIVCGINASITQPNSLIETSRNPKGPPWRTTLRIGVKNL